ncbi:alpha/beta fold hydrolase [Myceligenerans crystallogenes]|uniref:Alpha/beta fold hydrolase n=1 Tax=Myceligenerans crystallogenes TaxID=316335 RepID=A0ABN2NJ27_9MICO
MARIGTFKSDAARATFDDAYAAVERLWPLPATVRDVPTSYGSTRVRSSGSGDGPPFVLLHGFGGNGATWHGYVEALARDRAVHALDTMGAAGRSVQTAPLRRETDLARWFTEVLDGLGVERAHVVGESQGAWHATVMAMHAPGRLASVSLIEPNGVFARVPVRSLMRMLRLGANPTENGWRRMAAWLTPGVTLPGEVLAVAKAAQGFRPGLGWARTLTDAEVRSLSVPLLAILGDRSVVSNPVRTGDRLRSLAPRAEIEVYEDRGHGVLGEIPEEILGRVTAFASSHDSERLPTSRH